VGTALAALRRRSAPRVLPYVRVKRINPRVGRFGHWWIELDGVESYGWWPHRCPVRPWSLLIGGKGAVNGTAGSSAGGSQSRDPHHLDEAEHDFHPVLTVPKSDRRVRADIRRFASDYTGARWRWSTKPETDDCRTFQVRLMAAVGLVEPEDRLDSRGRGCPFLALLGQRRRELV
jgi:hypothetical protein